MQLTTFLLTATALLATSASAADCFNTGHNWGDHGPAKEKLTDACGKLKGTYQPSDVKRFCENSGGNSFNFEIKSHASGNKVVSQGMCEQQIGDVIDHCGHGGTNTVDGIEYRGDPNSGSC